MVRSEHNLPILGPTGRFIQAVLQGRLMEGEEAREGEEAGEGVGHTQNTTEGRPPPVPQGNPGLNFSQPQQW